TVFAMEPHVKNVTVSVETNALVSVTGSSMQSISFTKPGDGQVDFRLNVASQLGIAHVKVIAVCCRERSVQEIDLDVRASSPPVANVQEIALEPGKDWTGPMKLAGMKGSNHSTIELSRIPSFNPDQRLQYLICYPHGCI